ncbi:hypothetical protein FOL47_008923 [Perkinsus chesapeaki]|uniref:Alpha 1,2-mannosyltransferase 2.4.1 n=1 Tax=Perkinsus chesapeaki TaxID=330153 RepID=A0A7J6LB07_PERCH|nr:hypothetical protein FOL47_008923 [Perkinsus chesapeaki]
MSINGPLLPITMRNMSSIVGNFFGVKKFSVSIELSSVLDGPSAGAVVELEVLFDTYLQHLLDIHLEDIVGTERCGAQLLRPIAEGVRQLTRYHKEALSSRDVELVEIITAYQIHKSCESALDTLDALADTVLAECCQQGATNARDCLRSNARRFLANAQYISHTVIDEEQEERLMAPFTLQEGHCPTQEEIEEAVDLIVQRLTKPLIEDSLSAFQVPNTMARELEPDYTIDKALMDLIPHATAALLNRTSSALINADFVDFLYHGGRVDLRPAHARGLPTRKAASLENEGVSEVSGSRLFATFHVDSRHYHNRARPWQICVDEATADPTPCSQSAGYLFHVNLFPPFNTSVEYHGSLSTTEGPLKLEIDNAFKKEELFEQVPYYVSRSAALGSVRAIFHSINHWSPEEVYVHPLVGNCQFIEKLLTASVRPRKLYVPINPLLGSEAVTVPEHTEWMKEKHEELVKGNPSGHGVGPTLRAFCSHPPPPPLPSLARPGGVAYNASCMNLPLADISDVEDLQSRCSLAGAEALLSPHGYVAEAIRGGSLAVFQWAPNAEEDAGRLKRIFTSDWTANPLTRYLLQDLNDSSMTSSKSTGNYWGTGENPIPRTPLTEYFVQRDNRGKCINDSCDCFPPFRGRLCEDTSPPRQAPSSTEGSQYKAVIHYLVPSRPREVNELAFGLRNLWEMYNHLKDLPVIIFHDGLTAEFRHQLVHASQNRIWFIYIEFDTIPPHVMDEMKPQPASIGYRQAIRWRSWPIYKEKCWARFDYALTLDTDSYLPGQWDQKEDIFDYMHNRNLTAVFTHFGRESAAAAVNFLQFFLLYCKLHAIDPRGSSIAKALIESNFKWYQQIIELDFEAVKLSWFVDNDAYEDLFQFMDSTGGFYKFRWGNNPFRTFALALLLPEDKMAALRVSYAHQGFCQCDDGQKCYRSSPASPWQCPSRAPHVFEANISISELLRQLQPWRGTEEQRSRVEEIADMVDNPSGSDELPARLR